MKKAEVQKEKPLQAVDVSEISVKNLIHTVRGQQVMMDSDLAMLYQVETRVLNQAVKRNIARFPERYRFQLTEPELESLKSQFVISSADSDHGGRRTMPYVFTEQGIAMLSAVLRSDIAVQVSVRIMDTFVEMRKFLANNSLMYEQLRKIELKQREYQKNTEEKFDKIFDYISEHEESSQKIFFEGQIYDAFSLLVDLISKAENRIVLIDNYVDIGTLNILSKKKEGVTVTIYTLKKTRLSEGDINNFNQQYPKLEIKFTKLFHDRFLIVDDNFAYHIGASIKDAGKKCFGISLIEDRRIVQDIVNRLTLEAEE